MKEAENHYTQKEKQKREETKIAELYKYYKWEYATLFSLAYTPHTI